MKRSLLILWFYLAGLALFSQPYGNEWINFSNIYYYKIKVFEDGIYRIPYSTLSGASPLFSSTPVGNYTIYNNGKQIPIYVSDAGTPGILDGADYIEFYGEKNKGFIDSFLYQSAQEQINPTISLFTDTAFYFLTSQPTNNPRFTVVANNLSNLPPKENFFMYKSIAPYTSRTYFPGIYAISGLSEIYKSTYDQAEGYTYSTFFGNSYPRDFTVNTPFIYQAGPSAKITAHFVNNSAREYHAAKIALNYAQIYLQAPRVYGFQFNKVKIPISTGQLINGNNVITFQDAEIAAVSQKQDILGYLEVEYPRIFHFGGTNKFNFTLPASPAKRYLEITGFDNTSSSLLYDLTEKLIYQGVQPVGNDPFKFHILGATLPNDTVPRQLYLRSANAFNTVTSIIPVYFVNYADPAWQAEYVIISHPSLYNDGNNKNWVEEYRIHRSSRYAVSQNGAINIETLYDQFGFGISKSPLAIRNFINYINDNWSRDVKYIFLIGKGRETAAIRNGGIGVTQCLIPTFGYPTSDILLAGRRQNDTALVAIGRLAAENGTHVRDYLDKIKTYEDSQTIYSNTQAIPPKLWQKQVIHLGGGLTQSEQVLLGGYLADYAKIASDTLWGASVFSRTKETAAPVDESLSQVIKARIDNGASLISFFGHSATGYFDFSIDEPENYTNYGKYPIILSLGCFVGFVHDVTPGYSERFVLRPNAGAIAFLAAVNISDIGGLNAYATILYNNFSRTNYTETFGTTIQRTHNEFISRFSTPGAGAKLAITYEMTLHGDPAIYMNQYPKPDYAIDETSVFFNPSSVTASSDSFDTNVIVTNLGRAVEDSIAVTLKRTVFYTDNTPAVFQYRLDIPAPYYRDTVTFRLPVNIANLGYGQNIFQPYVDADFRIDEMAEANNGLLSNGVTIQIQNDDIIPIYPYEFAIVPKPRVTLKASTIDPFAPARNYKFQIDTSELFTTINPDYHQEGTVFQSGGVVHWTPTLPYRDVEDSMVYYWRVKKDSDNANWHYSSFIYLKDEYPGWNQSHYFQWKKDDFLLMDLDSSDRIFKFSTNLNEIHVRTGRSGNYRSIEWDYNKILMYYHKMWNCGFFNGITFAVIDSSTGLPWESIRSSNDGWGNKFGNYHCTTEYYKQNAFDFATIGNHPVTSSYPNFSNKPWSVLIQNFLDSVPDGSFILMYSVVSGPTPYITYSLWDDTLVNALSQYGFPALQYKSGANTGNFIFFTQKGNQNFNPVLAQQVNFNTPLENTITFAGSWYQGQFTSPKIGPALEWGSVHWRKHPLSNLFTDKDTLDIIGVNNNGLDTVLLSTTSPDNFINNTSSYYINASLYPYLKLRLRSSDSTWRTPTQPDYWRVLYKKPPEAAINPSAHFILTQSGQVVDPNVHHLVSDSFDVGQGIHLEIALENITELGMDSMLTKYILRDASFSNAEDTIRYDSLPGLETMILVFDTQLNGNNFQGLNKLIIEANPYNDQIEQYHFNNIAEISFKAAADKINPLLDVTFDNQHILNGDIVSAKPNILITLKDENKFLALDTSSLLDVYLKYPNETIPRKMNYGIDPITFYPADAAKLDKGNKALVELKPELKVDGTYELIVKDRDRNGNNSSSTGVKYESNIFYDYKISFKVINKPMITNVLNYPNPFTTSTRFVFTLTGSEVPDIMKIQIMTIKGTVVKEINKEELGNIHVGTNITEYAWDGRDQYGDLLANGVYFYRIVSRLDDKRMDHMDQGFDKYFKKGFGKLVIIR